MTQLLTIVFTASLILGTQALAAGGAQETVLGHLMMIERSFKPDVDACSATLKASVGGGFSCEVAVMASATTDHLVSGDEKEYAAPECHVYAMASMSGYVLNVTGKAASQSRDQALACLRESFEKKLGDLRLKVVFQSVR
jgi:hypothetical protein